MRTVEAGDRIARKPQFLAWLRGQGLIPSDIYRIDIDGDTATVYEYKKNAGGNRYVKGGEVAKREPYTVTLTSQPPDLQ